MLCNGAPNRKSGNETTNFSAQRPAPGSETGGSKNRPDPPIYKNKNENKNKNKKRQATTCKQNVSGSDNKEKKDPLCPAPYVEGGEVMQCSD